MTKENQGNPMMISRRNFTIIGGATLLAYLTNGCIGKDTAVKGTENLYQQGAEVPVSGNVADYVRFDGDKAIFDILDASTKKNGWVVDYGLFPKSDANDNVMNDGFIKRPEIYGGVINDGQKLWNVELFNDKFMEKYPVMGQTFNPSVNDVLELKWADEGDFKVAKHKNYMQLSEELFFWTSDLLTGMDGVAFGSPDKSIGLYVHKVA